MGNMDHPWNFFRQVREHRTRSKNHLFTCNLHSLEKYKCKKCYYQSDLKVFITKHFKTFHKTEETQHYLNSVARNCKNCDFLTYSSLVLLNHHTSCCDTKGIRDGNTSLVAEADAGVKSEYDVCGTVQNVTRLPAKGKKSPKRKKNGRFQCDHCSYTTIREKYLKMHMRRMHTPSQQINWSRCEHCSFKTKEKGNLDRHVFERHPEKVEPKKLKHYNKCNHCSYTTIRKSRLRDRILAKHTRTGSELINWFKSEYCSYKNKQKHHLDNHTLSVHPQIVEPKELKWFQCDRCSFRTIKEEDLKIHFLQHSAEPKSHLLIPSELVHWFKCDQCPYKTTSTGDLKAHIYKRHKTTSRECLKANAPSEQIDRFRCEDCPYEAKQKSQLDQHITALHPKTEESKILKCDYCSFETVKTDKARDKLRLHMNRNHTLV